MPDARIERRADEDGERQQQIGFNSHAGKDAPARDESITKAKTPPAGRASALHPFLTQ
jgi:hypothetical protein